MNPAECAAPAALLQEECFSLMQADVCYNLITSRAGTPYLLLLISSGRRSIQIYYTPLQVEVLNSDVTQVKVQ